MQNVSAQQIIYTALRIARITKGPGRVPSSDQVQDGLDTLNALIDSWNTEQLTIPATVRVVWPLVSGQGIYAIGDAGSGADFAGQWTQRLDAVGLLITEQTGLPYELPLKQLTLTEFEALRFKNQPSTLPTRFYYDGAYPTGNLNLWPWPTDPNSVCLYYGTTLAGFAAADSTVTLYPGYLRALEYSLAVELAPRWPDAEISPIALQTAIEAKGLIKARNIRPLLLACDPGVTRRAERTWNWLIGEPS